MQRPAVLSQDIQIAFELKRRLSTLVPLVDMRLYGSRARGDAREGSDMDIFIEVEDANQAIKNAIADAAWEIGLERLIHISPLVYTRDEIENSPQRSSQIVRNIMREGIKL